MTPGKPTPNTLHCGDCLEVLGTWADACVDFVFGSPPYEDARTYGIDYRHKGQTWVDWMIPRVVELCRVSKGLVGIVMSGKVSQFSYSPVVEWLVADLTRKHDILCGPAPYVFHRIGICGSGSTHYHRRDWEPVYLFAEPTKLPPHWSDNTVMGHPPKWAPGGEMSHFLDGTRKNQWGSAVSGKSIRARDVNGKTPDSALRPSHSVHTKRLADGRMENQAYVAPVLANPGNVVYGNVGGGHMGNPLAHSNEACFPVWLAEFFVRSYCPPGGVVLDPFVGSGTTCEVALHHGRNYVGIDVRDSQTRLTQERLGLFA